MKFDKGIIDYAEKINLNFEDVKQSVYQKTYDNLIKFVVYLMLVSALLIVICIIIRLKNKVRKEYNRNPSTVINPILAEAIINQKIDAKELFSKKIYSKPIHFILSIIKFIPVMVLANLSVVLASLVPIDDIDLLGKNEIIIFNIITFLFILIVKNISNIKSWAEKIDIFKLRFTTLFIIVCVIYLIFSAMMDVWIYLWEYIFLLISFIMDIYFWRCYKSLLLLVIVTIILNIFLIKKLNVELLTKYGKEEQKKAYGLKSYIIDYSLMKERELESHILWDDYLTYSIAFGISNKVTERFGEFFMNSNIVLQKINEFNPVKNRDESVEKKK